MRPRNDLMGNHDDAHRSLVVSILGRAYFRASLPVKKPSAGLVGGSLAAL